VSVRGMIQGNAGAGSCRGSALFSLGPWSVADAPGSVSALVVGCGMTPPFSQGSVSVFVTVERSRLESRFRSEEWPPYASRDIPTASDARGSVSAMVVGCGMTPPFSQGSVSVFVTVERSRFESRFAAKNGRRTLRGTFHSF
jgi:hypothetical protein